MSNFQSLEVVDRGSETQPQVVENLNKLTEQQLTSQGDDSTLKYLGFKIKGSYWLFIVSIYERIIKYTPVISLLFKFNYIHTIMEFYSSDIMYFTSLLIKLFDTIFDSPDYL